MTTTHSADNPRGEIGEFNPSWREITNAGRLTGWVRTGIDAGGKPAIVDAHAPDQIDGYTLPRRPALDPGEQPRLFSINWTAA